MNLDRARELVDGNRVSFPSDGAEHAGTGGVELTNPHAIANTTTTGEAYIWLSVRYDGDRERVTLWPSNRLISNKCK